MLPCPIDDEWNTTGVLTISQQAQTMVSLLAAVAIFVVAVLSMVRFEAMQECEPDAGDAEQWRGAAQSGRGRCRAFARLSLVGNSTVASRDFHLATYSGEWRRGAMHGRGELLSRSGIVARGEWRDNVPVAVAAEMPDGSLINATFDAHGQPTGRVSVTLGRVAHRGDGRVDSLFGDGVRLSAADSVSGALVGAATVALLDNVTVRGTWPLRAASDVSELAGADDARRQAALDAVAIAADLASLHLRALSQALAWRFEDTTADESPPIQSA